MESTFGLWLDGHGWLKSAGSRVTGTREQMLDTKRWMRLYGSPFQASWALRRVGNRGAGVE
jgi:hypothetical protein